MKFNSTSLFILLLLCVACACNNKVYDESSLSNTSELITENDGVDKIPSVIERRKLIDEALKKPIPAILLNDSGNTNIKLAQELILDHPVLKNYFFNKKGDPMLNEVFTVQPATSGDLTALKLPSNNTGNNFYKVEWYNYPLNTTISFITDLAAKKVVSMQEYPNIQPDVNEALKRIAVDIATHSTYIQKELGTTPSASDAQMAYTKTALNKSRCERSHHLCVAPTFIKEQKALWSIVDLTDLKLVGYRWTFVGDPGPVRVTERVLQNEKITECFCKVENKIEQQGWKLNYMLTSSDGLKISEVAFNNKKVLSSAKLVDWHVSYSNSDGFGYSDGVGCPTFSTSAVLAIEAPKVYDLEEGNRKVGFVLEQKFYSEGWPNVCNYNYLQRYEFYADGRFRIACASLGRGCGNDGTYRPVYRIAFADAGSFAEYDGSDFKNWDTEKWTLQKDNSPATKEGYMYRLNTPGGNYFIEPGRGQFGDGGRGDHAYVYVTENKNGGPDEGELDLPTIGPCCNNDYKQGPEKFIEPNPDNIVNKKLVLWYISQMKNDDTPNKEYCWAKAYLKNGVYTTQVYPCFAGPMFIPQK